MKESQPTSPPAGLGSLEGERGLPSVNDTWSAYKKRSWFFMGIPLIVAIVGSTLYLKYKKNADPNVKVPEDREQQISSSVPKRLFLTQDAPPLPEQITKSNVVKSVLQQSVPVEQTILTDHGRTSEQNLQLLAIYTSPLMISNDAKPENKEQPTPLGKIKEQISLPYGIDQKSNKENKIKKLSKLMKSTSTPLRKASFLGDRNFILAKGSFIDCALQTKLDSTVPGMTSCTVTRNIYSDNGKILLIERGSTISGEYQSNVQQGMKRIFVLWSRLKTPNGIVVDLESPGADSLGASGLPGHVEDHFWKRFGGAMMLSLVDDIAKAASSSKNSSSTNLNFNSTGEAAQNMAAEALKNTINIPPTLYKNQGEQIGIYIARDLDFSSVYSIELQ